MGVPFVDLKAQYHSIKAEVDAALIATMESCAFTLGPEVAALEKDFAPYAGTTYAAGVNNGTNALYLPCSPPASARAMRSSPFPSPSSRRLLPSPTRAPRRCSSTSTR